MWKFVLFLIVASQAAAQQTANFRTVVEDRLRERYRAHLSTVCPIDTDAVAERIFREYGAIYVAAEGVELPAKCILDSDAAVQAVQARLNQTVADIGGVIVTLQKPAMAELQAARQEAAKLGLNISPRGGSTASMRSFQTTVDLWRSRFEPALVYWTNQKRITRDEAAAAKKAMLPQQIAMVLAWEQKGIFFSRDLSKSILYSVAVPGASQHIFMLALDIEQYGDKRIRDILARHGWFQTVKSDLPHFTYLGVAEKQLPSLGLTRVFVSGQAFWIPNM
jgi:hypothetical protein